MRTLYIYMNINNFIGLSSYEMRIMFPQNEHLLLTTLQIGERGTNFINKIMFPYHYPFSNVTFSPFSNVTFSPFSNVTFSPFSNVTSFPPLATLKTISPRKVAAAEQNRCCRTFRPCCRQMNSPAVVTCFRLSKL